VAGAMLAPEKFILCRMDKALKLPPAQPPMWRNGRRNGLKI